MPNESTTPFSKEPLEPQKSRWHELIKFSVTPNAGKLKKSTNFEGTRDVKPQKFRWHELIKLSVTPNAGKLKKSTNFEGTRDVKPQISLKLKYAWRASSSTGLSKAFAHAVDLCAAFLAIRGPESLLYFTSVTGTYFTSQPEQLFYKSDLEPAWHSFSQSFSADSEPVKQWNRSDQEIICLQAALAQAYICILQSNQLGDEARKAAIFEASANTRIPTSYCEFLRIKAGKHLSTVEKLQTNYSKFHTHLLEESKKFRKPELSGLLFFDTIAFFSEYCPEVVLILDPHIPDALRQIFNPLSKVEVASIKSLGQSEKEFTESLLLCLNRIVRPDDENKKLPLFERLTKIEIEATKSSEQFRWEQSIQVMKFPPIYTRESLIHCWLIFCRCLKMQKKKNQENWTKSDFESCLNGVKIQAAIFRIEMKVIGFGIIGNNHILGMAMARDSCEIDLPEELRSRISVMKQTWSKSIYNSSHSEGTVQGLPLHTPKSITYETFYGQCNAASKEYHIPNETQTDTFNALCIVAFLTVVAPGLLEHFWQKLNENDGN